jgi:hypothetical protein
LLDCATDSRESKIQKIIKIIQNLDLPSSQVMNAEDAALPVAATVELERERHLVANADTLGCLYNVSLQTELGREQFLGKRAVRSGRPAEHLISWAKAPATALLQEDLRVVAGESTGGAFVALKIGSKFELNKLKICFWS